MPVSNIRLADRNLINFYYLPSDQDEPVSPCENYAEGLADGPNGAIGICLKLPELLEEMANLDFGVRHLCFVAICRPFPDGVHR